MKILNKEKTIKRKWFKNQSIHSLKIKLNKIKTLLETATFFVSKEKYVFLVRNQNKELFKLLEAACFFKLHTSNRKKQIVGLHQVVLYVHRGWKKLYFGHEIIQGQFEIHHLDHNPSNNTIDNLWYTTPTNNKVIADITSICCNTSAKYYNAEVKFDLDKVNLFGAGNFCELLIKSIKATSKNFGKDLFKELLLNLPFKQSRLIYNMSLKYI